MSATAAPVQGRRSPSGAGALSPPLQTAQWSDRTVIPTERLKILFGSRVYGLGVMALGLATLAFGEFDPGQLLSENFPYRTALAYTAGALMVLGAAALQWRRTAAWGAATLAVYYLFVVVVLIDGRLLLTHYFEFGTYEELSMQLAIALGGLMVYARTATMSAALSALMVRVSQLAFGVCALIWGGAHFIYVNLTAPLVPKWLPPSQAFWGYATGVCFIAAGAAILTGVQARRAAILLTGMITCFGILVNDRILLTGLGSHWNWSESSLNLALTGVAWVVAESLAHSGQATLAPKGPSSIFHRRDSSLDGAND